MFNRIQQHLNLPSDASAPEAAAETAEELKARASEGAQQAVVALRTQIIEYPARTLAIAFALGATLGWIIKRR